MKLLRKWILCIFFYFDVLKNKNLSFFAIIERRISMNIEVQAVIFDIDDVITDGKKYTDGTS